MTEKEIKSIICSKTFDKVVCNVIKAEFVAIQKNESKLSANTRKTITDLVFGCVKIAQQELSNKWYNRIINWVKCLFN